MKTTRTALCLLLLNFYCSFLFAQDGTLDSTFDNDGKVLTNVGTFNDEAHGIAIQSDGKIVVVGQSYIVSKYLFTVIRYNSNGSLDTTFGNNGIVWVDFGTSGGVANSIAIQTDGKIVVAGHNNSDFALARLNSNGTLDLSFDLDGIVTTNFSTTSSSFELLNKITLQNDGKILAGGTALFGNFDCVLARYNTDGSLDTTFGNNGKVITAHPNGLNEYCNDVVLQTDNKIVIAGYISTGGTNDYQIIRYNTNGTLDTSFNFTGKAYTDFGTTQDVASCIRMQSDGKIVVCGNSSNGIINSISVARYNSDGSLDRSFDTDGKLLTSYNDVNAFGNSFIIKDDKILLGATINNDFGLVRYFPNGSIDTSFGINGTVVTDFINSIDNVAQMAIENDGKIILAGKSFTDTTTAFALARFNNNTLSTTGFSLKNISIYPNPATSILNIQNQENLQIDKLTIYDVSGKKVIEENKKSTSINIQNLESGIYFLQITSDEKNAQMKFIKN